MPTPIPTPGNVPTITPTVTPDGAGVPPVVDPESYKKGISDGLVLGRRGAKKSSWNSLLLAVKDNLNDSTRQLLTDYLRNETLDVLDLQAAVDAAIAAGFPTAEIQALIDAACTP